MSTFLGEFKTFFENFGHVFKDIFKKAPTYEQSAIAVVAYVAPALQIILGLLDPAALPIVNPIISRVEANLAALKTITSSIQVAPGSSTSAGTQQVLAEIQSDMGAILGLAQVKNAAKFNQVETTVNGILAEVQLLVQTAPAA